MLVANGQLPKTHSIEELSEMAPIEGGWDAQDVLKLDRFYIAARYPDALPSGSTIRKHFTPKDAQEAIAIAQGGMDILSRWAASLGVLITLSGEKSKTSQAAVRKPTKGPQVE